MKAADPNINILQGYLSLLESLSPDGKLEIIARLSDSLKTSKQPKERSLKSLYGAFKSSKSADKIVEEIRSSRTFKRNIESL